jgi:hypothetical protein
VTSRAFTPVLVVLFLLFLSGCEFQRETDAKFADQHFKTVVSLVELHKVRFGSYPNTLSELKFVGEWDQIALHSVEYHKVESGYELNVTRGWVAAPTEQSYPPEFWQGLGIVKSNVLRSPTSSANGG